MISFLLKGLLRDRSRSLFPLLTVFLGVLLTVALHSWLNGSITSLITSTAHFNTGHVRVMTRAYAREANQVPNDLALLGIDTLMTELRHDYPDLMWTPRIKFGGLLDVPDAKGETRAQIPVSGLGIDLFSGNTPEPRILNISDAIVRGRAPLRRGEMVIGEEGAQKLNLQPGDTATLISSTMNGSMSFTNFVIVGTVRFGIVAMDKGTVIADIADVRQALDMENGAGEILGFSRDDLYHEDRTNAVTAAFNARHAVPAADSLSRQYAFSPVMGTLRTESGLSDYLDMVGLYSGIIIVIFVLAMSVVLWNAGLTGSLRRYGEIGIRLAVGEDRRHIYGALLVESLMIGFAGSVLGTASGLALAWYGQVRGLDIGAIMKGATLMMPTLIRAQITPFTYVIGFIPGLLATFLGTAISGIGIFKRQTSQLFKELE